MFESDEEYLQYSSLLQEITDLSRIKPEHLQAFESAVKPLVEKYKRLLTLTEDAFQSRVPGCDTLSLKEKRFCRVVRKRYETEPLGSVGSKAAHGRFHKRDTQPTIYLGEDEFVCFSEISSRGLPDGPTVAFPAHVTLTRVLDISEPNCCKAYGLSFDMISEEWAWIRLLFGENIEYTYTQMVGKIASSLGYEAILYESVRSRGKNNLAVFTENLLLGSRIALNGDSPDLNCFPDKTAMCLEGYLAPLSASVEEKGESE